MSRRNKQAREGVSAEYDFSHGVRGKYSGRARKESPVYFRSEQESKAAAKNGAKRSKGSAPRRRAASSKAKTKKHSVPA
jgi:hypothetical protein